MPCVLKESKGETLIKPILGSKYLKNPNPSSLTKYNAGSTVKIGKTSKLALTLPPLALPKETPPDKVNITKNEDQMGKGQLKADLVSTVPSTT
jgi:hypothetical protein